MYIIVFICIYYIVLQLRMIYKTYNVFSPFFAVEDQPESTYILVGQIITGVLGFAFWGGVVCICWQLGCKAGCVSWLENYCTLETCVRCACECCCAILKCYSCVHSGNIAAE